MPALAPQWHPTAQLQTATLLSPALQHSRQLLIYFHGQHVLQVKHGLRGKQEWGSSRRVKYSRFVPRYPHAVDYTLPPLHPPHPPSPASSACSARAGPSRT